MLMAPRREPNETSPKESEQGRARVVSVVAINGRDDSALIAMAAGLASGLSAQLAAAIRESALERGVSIPNIERWHETTPAGAIAVVAGRTVVLGSATLFSALGLSVDSLGDWPERLRRRGEHLVFVAVDGQAAGCFGVVDAESETPCFFPVGGL